MFYVTEKYEHEAFYLTLDTGTITSKRTRGPLKIGTILFFLES
jgi:hypothetical protein